jgi:hypothetical protein
MKTITTFKKTTDSRCDYYNLPKDVKQKHLKQTLENVSAIMKTSASNIMTSEAITKGVLPVRGKDNKIGSSGSKQSIIDFVMDLVESKFHKNDLSGIQISSLNHINELFEAEEIRDVCKLPHRPSVLVNRDNNQVIYKVTSPSKELNKNVYRPTNTSDSTFNDLFQGVEQ